MFLLFEVHRLCLKAARCCVVAVEREPRKLASNQVLAASLQQSSRKHTAQR
jgi:hypothetical protein